MVDLSSSETNLDQFIAENTLPCYAYVKKALKFEPDKLNESDGLNLQSSKPGGEKTEELYLLYTFESDCISARCYSSNFEKILINQRNSFTQSDIDYLTWQSNYLTLTQNRKSMISEEVVIPFGYQGLFEMFSTNSTKLGGILDHETDIITLASRFESPACYFVAKELNVYEIYNEKSSSIIYKYLNSLNLLKKGEKQPIQYNRKWTKLPVGTICKVIRVANVDCFNDTHSYIQMCQALFCCYKSKNKSEMAIEFKVVENFDELMRPGTNIAANKLDQVPKPNTYSKKFTEKLSEKSYYIPVDVDNPNKTIDLIPIAPVNKNVIVRNSLQTIKNFETMNLVENPNMEVKLFADNLFPEAKKIQSDSKSDAQSLSTERYKMNLKLEMCKFSSIFEAYESVKACKFLVGYNLTKQQLFFAPIPKSNPKSAFRRMNETDLGNSSLVQKFQKKKYLINKLADLKVKEFNFELNTVETFIDETQKTCNTDLLRSSKIVKNRTISHFADLINGENFKKGSVSQKSIKLSRFKVEKHIEDVYKDTVTPQTRTSEQTKEEVEAMPLFNKPRKYHSHDNINSFSKPILLSQDIMDRMNEKKSHLKLNRNLLNEDYDVERKFETLKSLEFISRRSSSHPENSPKVSPVFFQSKLLKSNSTNLCRTRSRSLPSIFIVFNDSTSCCKKTIL